MEGLKVPVILLLVVFAALFLVFGPFRGPPKPTGEPAKTGKPADVSTQIRLAKEAFDKNRFEEMLTQLEPVKTMDDHNVQALLGFAYAGIKDFPAAAQAFEKALAKKRDPTYGYSLAYIYENLLEMEKAKALYLDLANAPLGKLTLVKVKLGAARCALALNEFPTAVKAFKEVMTLDPTREEPFVGIIKLMKMARSGKDIEKLREKGDVFHEKSFLYQFNLGLLYYELGDFGNAQKAIKAALALNPKNSSPFYFLYQILRKSKKIEESVAELEKFYTLNPCLPYIFFEAALDAKDQGRLDLAFKFFRSSVTMDRSLLGRDDRGTLYAIEQYLKQSGTPEEKAFFKALFNFVNGDFQTALSQVQALLPKIKDLRLKEDADRIRRECNGMLHQEAQYSVYQTRLQQDQDAAMATLRAKIAARKGVGGNEKQPKESAPDDLKRIAMANPKNVKLQYSTALQLSRLGDINGAKLFLGETIRLDPNIHEAYYSLAKISRYQGRLEEASDHLSEAIKRSPGNSQALSFAALVHLEMGDTDRSQKEAEGAISANPNNGEARLVLAKILAQTQQNDKALAEINFGLAVEADTVRIGELKSLKQKLEQKQ